VVGVVGGGGGGGGGGIKPPNSRGSFYLSFLSSA